MKASVGEIELLESREITRFIPVMQEIDLGDRFLLSMLHWCGIGQRSTPLDYWKVFLIQSSNEIVGVSGLYRQPGMDPTTLWIGWFGIRPAWRRQGFGTKVIRK